MKKQLVFLVIISVVGVSMLSAHDRGRGGNFSRKGDNRRGFGFEDCRYDLDRNLEDAEEIQSSGKLFLENGEFPKVETKEGTYIIHAPWRELRDLNLKDGMKIDFKGIIMPNPPLVWESSEKSVMLKELTINGVVINVERRARRPRR